MRCQNWRKEKSCYIVSIYLNTSLGKQTRNSLKHKLQSKMNQPEESLPPLFTPSLLSDALSSLPLPPTNSGSNSVWTSPEVAEELVWFFGDSAISGSTLSTTDESGESASSRIWCRSRSRSTETSRETDHVQGSEWTNNRTQERPHADGIIVKRSAD